MSKTYTTETVESAESIPASRQSRRKFLGKAGLAGLAAAGILSCNKLPGFPWGGGSHGGGDAVDLGSGDTGILNYAYALEQLEAAFYIRVCKDPYGNMNNGEKRRLEEIRNHEVAHREFFKNALGGDAIPALEVDFSSINFRKRESVLGAAKAFEDLGVSAYNGAGSLIENVDYLTLAGKIVSVEARHAAYIRDLLNYGDFAGPDVVDSNGLDKSRKPNEVLSMASMFIKTKIDASHLPS